VKNPRHVPAGAEGGSTERALTGPGAPRPVSYRGVLLRAGIVCVLFFPYLIYIAGESPGIAFLVTLLAFAIMLPVGIVLDRFRYRIQARRFERRRAGG
jgi:hypothetical protein